MTSRLLLLLLLPGLSFVVVISFDCHLLACFGFGVGFGFGFVFPALLCHIIRFTIFMSFSRLPCDVFIVVVVSMCRVLLLLLCICRCCSLPLVSVCLSVHRLHLDTNIERKVQLKIKILRPQKANWFVRVLWQLPSPHAAAGYLTSPQFYTSPFTSSCLIALPQQPLGVFIVICLISIRAPLKCYSYWLSECVWIECSKQGLLLLLLLIPDIDIWRRLSIYAIQVRADDRICVDWDVAKEEEEGNRVEA